MTEKLTLARPYAKAIFELAENVQDHKDWSSMLSMLATIVVNSDVKELLKNTMVSMGKIEVFFLEVCDSHLNEQGKNLLRMLVQQRHLDLIPFIRARYEELRKKAERRLDVKFISAAPLSKEQEAQFSSFFERQFKKTVKLNVEIDPTLQGGYRATTGDTVIEDSIKGHLEQLKKAMGG